ESSWAVSTLLAIVMIWPALEVSLGKPNPQVYTKCVGYVGNSGSLFLGHNTHLNLPLKPYKPHQQGLHKS
ncbi:MAG: hypothetical protein RPR28_06610, partial [Cycloclasticus sp.]